MGRSTIPMAIFNSNLLVYQREPVTYHKQTIPQQREMDRYLMINAWFPVFVSTSIGIGGIGPTG